MDYVALQSRLRPDQVAVADLASERDWTYREFDELIAGCAKFLQVRGVVQGDRVGCLSKNRAEIVALHMACARLGAIFVPLNWRLSPPELQALLDDCQPKLLLGDSLAQQLGFPHESLDALPGSHSVQPVALPPRVDGSLPSLILYTSGTTGKPKGALLSEKNLTETAINFTVLGNVNSSSAFLCDAPMFHVIGAVTNVRPAFFNGGRIVISDGFDPERTLERLTDRSLAISHYFCVPQMARALRNARGFDPEQLRHLTAVFTGGAPHPAAHIREWLDDGIAIVDGFGMSESGTVFGMPLDREIIREKAGSVGVPTPRIEARVVDAEGAVVGTGSAGELQLRGDNICHTYWGYSRRESGAFTQDGWFRTGDVVRVDEDGFYWIVDRMKDMFISGGENVYPVQVESVVCEDAAVAECAVVGVPDERWGEAGWLFVVAKKDSRIDPQSLLASLDGKLARYKIPKHVTLIDALPRNASGKMLKQVLRDRAIGERGNDTQ